MISVGCRTESIKKFSEQSLIDYIKNLGMKGDKGKEILQRLVKNMMA